MGKNYSRKPDIMADAAYCILTQEPKPTGQFFIDDEVLVQAGVQDLDQYACNPANKDNLTLDFYVDSNLTDNFSPRVTNTNPAKEVKQEASGASDGKIPDVFKAIEGSLGPKIVENTQAIFQFVVTGDEAGKW